METQNISGNQCNFLHVFFRDDYIGKVWWGQTSMKHHGKPATCLRAGKTVAPGRNVSRCFFFTF